MEEVYSRIFPGLGKSLEVCNRPVGMVIGFGVRLLELTVGPN